VTAEELVEELTSVCCDLLASADRPPGSKRDVDAIIRAEAILKRLDKRWGNSWQPEVMETTDVPGLLRQGWTVYWEVKLREDDWTDPLIFGMLSATIRSFRNRALKTILIPRP